MGYLKEAIAKKRAKLNVNPYSGRKDENDKRLENLAVGGNDYTSLSDPTKIKEEKIEPKVTFDSQSPNFSTPMSPQPEPKTAKPDMTEEKVDEVPLEKIEPVNEPVQTSPAPQTRYQQLNGADVNFSTRPPKEYVNPQNAVDNTDYAQANKEDDVPQNVELMKTEQMRMPTPDVPTVQTPDKTDDIAFKPIKNVTDAEREYSRILDIVSKDPDYAQLVAEDPAKAVQIYQSRQAQSLEEQLKILKPETPLAKEKREKKERIERNILAMISLAGALGNFAAASTSRDGRSTSVADIMGAFNKRMNTNQEQRDKNLAMFNQLQDKKAALINQGYKEVRERKALEVAQKQKDFDNEMKRAELVLKGEKNAAEVKKLKAEAEAAIAKNDPKSLDNILKMLRIKNEEQELENKKQSFRNSIQTYNNNKGKDHIELGYNNGTETYNIKNERWTPEAKASAWNLITDETKKEVIDGLVEFVKMPDVAEQSGLDRVEIARIRAFASMTKAEQYRSITQNDNLFSIGIGMALAKEGDKEKNLHNYLNNLSYNKKVEEQSEESKKSGYPQEVVDFIHKHPLAKIPDDLPDNLKAMLK